MRTVNMQNLLSNLDSLISIVDPVSHGQTSLSDLTLIKNFTNTLNGGALQAAAKTSMGFFGATQTQHTRDPGQANQSSRL